MQIIKNKYFQFLTFTTDKIADIFNLFYSNLKKNVSLHLKNTTKNIWIFDTTLKYSVSYAT